MKNLSAGFNFFYRVNSFLTAHHHNLTVQCHSCRGKYKIKDI